MSRDVVTSDHLITPFIFHDNQQQPPHTWLVLGISTVLFVSPCLCHCPVTSCPATIIWNIILSDQTQTTDSLLLLSPFTTYRSVLQTVSVDVNDQKIVRILSSKRSLSAGNLHHLRWYLSLSLSLSLCRVSTLLTLMNDIPDCLTLTFQWIIFVKLGAHQSKWEILLGKIPAFQ